MSLGSHGEGLSLLWGQLHGNLVEKKTPFGGC